MVTVAAAAGTPIGKSYHERSGALRAGEVAPNAQPPNTETEPQQRIGLAVAEGEGGRRRRKAKAEERIIENRVMPRVQEGSR
jgi:hypothetical protein